MIAQFSVHWSIFISTVGTVLMFLSLESYERLLSKEALNVLSKLAFQAVCVWWGAFGPRIRSGFKVYV